MVSTQIFGDLWLFISTVGASLSEAWVSRVTREEDCRSEGGATVQPGVTKNPLAGPSNPWTLRWEAIEPRCGDGWGPAVERAAVAVVALRLTRRASRLA